MKALGVNRVIIIVKDLEKGKEHYSKLLGATWQEGDTDAAARYGHRAVLSWDAGIELIEPLPDGSMANYFEQGGQEGLVGVVFRTDNIEQARAAIDELGIQIPITIEYDKKQIDEIYQGMFTKYKEYVLEPGSCGTGSFVIGQLDPR